MLLSDQIALDQLGTGSVRDAYADLLFPGISTQQTTDQMQINHRELFFGFYCLSIDLHMFRDKALLLGLLWLWRSTDAVPDTCPNS